VLERNCATASFGRLALGVGWRSVTVWTRRDLAFGRGDWRRSAIHPLRPISARYRMDRRRPIAAIRLC